MAPTIKVCLFEGNYVALDKEEWAEAAALMDEIWWVEVDENLARQRLVRRHVKAGIVKDEEEARRRADENDLPNGREIIRGRVSKCHPEFFLRHLSRHPSHLSLHTYHKLLILLFCTSTADAQIP